MGSLPHSGLTANCWRILRSIFAYKFIWRLIKASGKWRRPTAMPFSSKRQLCIFHFSGCLVGMSLVLSLAFCRYISVGRLFRFVIKLSGMVRWHMFMLIGSFSIKLCIYDILEDRMY